MPAAPPTYVGLDLGTSSLKGVLVDADGVVLGGAERPLALSTPSPLAAEQDPAEWWGATVEVLRELSGAADPARLAAIGLSGQKHAFLPLDAQGEPLGPAVLWCDARASAEIDEVHARVDRARLARRTGALATPGTFLPKWLRFRRRRPELAARTARFLFAKDWLRFRLCGEHATDRTEASASLLFDVGRKVWAEDLVEAFELPRGALPRVVRSSDLAGRVTREAAAATGIPAGTPIVGGAGDNEAGALACGAIGGGVVAAILGTSATVVAAVEERGAAGGLVYGRHATRSGYAATGVVLSSGRALEWIRRAAFDERATIGDVLAAAEASDPREGPLVFLPGLTGERSPVPDPGAYGGFLGLRPGHGRGHLARAVVEGIAVAISEILDLLRGAGARVEDVRLTSGGSASPFFRRTIAAAAGIPVRPMRDTFGPAFGAAMLAARGTGRFQSLVAGVAAWVPLPTPEAPHADETARLASLRTSARSARVALRGAAAPKRRRDPSGEGSSRA